ncbi:MAG: penicillin acylase family protein, partial [Opitutaceae bacterium]|nr:penicillin acylase family protein [Opitutaceae bacterium]
MQNINMRTRLLAILTAAGMASVVVLLPASATAPQGSDPAAADGRYQEFGDTGGFWNVFAPGQTATMTAEELQANLQDSSKGPKHAFDQIAMYNALAHADPTTITNDALTTYFKDASFGVAPEQIERSYHPGENPDVVVVRDTTAGVPHIFGTTRYATMFAQGYTAAEDRLLIMD